MVDLAIHNSFGHLHVRWYGFGRAQLPKQSY